ncbi:hypothetical protein Xmau_04176 [Xenorhabdus mauleonii]|uniref:Uncharacterized protein n=1 Tax=Xenorhabdus mauleonii TaxID=351675 RepID=A0A1I3WWP0_9GAMM|nr:hypothetical protein Xmau_04176 [Xenorhabdus mauleonii]SFK11753.1 hypothetical protein SAMN05421680_13012 [Xenorhabdus mauleonii]
MPATAFYLAITYLFFALDKRRNMPTAINVEPSKVHQGLHRHKRNE